MKLERCKSVQNRIRIWFIRVADRVNRVVLASKDFSVAALLFSFSSIELINSQLSNGNFVSEEVIAEKTELHTAKRVKPDHIR